MVQVQYGPGAVGGGGMAYALVDNKTAQLLQEVDTDGDQLITKEELGKASATVLSKLETADPKLAKMVKSASFEPNANFAWGTAWHTVRYGDTSDANVANALYVLEEASQKAPADPKTYPSSCMQKEVFDVRKDGENYVVTKHSAGFAGPTTNETVITPEALKRALSQKSDPDPGEITADEAILELVRTFEDIRHGNG
jgi:hypothetical protein